MCWSTNKKLIKQIAKQDIVVKKVLTMFGDELKSPCYGEIVWNKNPLQRLKGEIIAKYIESDNSYEIELGFHSCENIEKDYFVWSCNKEKILFSYSDDDVLCECIIPEGSTYYVNEYGEYVSDALKYIRTL